MAKFKVGDKVRVAEHPDDKCEVPNCAMMIEEMAKMAGKVVVIEEVIGKNRYTIKEDKGGLLWSDCMFASRRGRPAKPKPVKFIAVYDENDVDPVKEFASKREVTEWLREASKDESIDFDSIKVYPVGGRLKVKTNFSLVSA